MSKAGPPHRMRRRPELVRAVLRHHFGRVPTGLERLTAGATNEVWGARAGGGRVVVRIGYEPRKLAEFQKEQWAVGQARLQRIPVPEILEVGSAPIGKPYMIAEAVEGHDATEWPDPIALLRRLGALARRVHRIRTAGFGSVFDWSPNRLSRGATWRDFLERELELEWRLGVLAANRMISERRRRRIEAVLRDLEPPRAALNHGDLRLKNVIVDRDGRIKALLDWESCTSSAAPQWDLSIALHDLTIDGKEAFLEGYGLAPRELREISPSLKALNVLHYAKEVARLAKAKDAASLARIRERLLGSLDLYAI